MHADHLAGEARGVLGVCSREAGRFDEGDLEVVEVFARFASLALHNAESFEERERQTQVQRGFYRIAQVLGSTLSRAETWTRSRSLPVMRSEEMPPWSWS